ncbi:serine/threonine-protein kinase [Streptomyces aureus]|uniref:serine/threonine-protein kinase n=1 Tax=Streptomyces aureus TaxID=193461 RepID=UPI000A711F35|nr:serine/threonine-protein kinase [Streptomyces aureus]
MGFVESGVALASRGSSRVLTGRYRLDGLIGSGGAADVHRGFDLRLRRPVAVKIFRPGTGFDTEEDYRSEAVLLARLHHQGLVTAYDAGRHGGDAYLVMQLIEGPTLKSRIAQGPLPWGTTATLGAGLADALAHAHDAGVVHRDVKPSNIILDGSGGPHLTDFGISRLLDTTTRAPTGALVGTAAYLSPEQVLGEPVGRPADVYALGLVLLECLTGRIEYDGGPLEAAIARLHRRPGVPDSVPRTLAGLLWPMTALDAGARPTARECAHALAFLADETAAADPTAPAVGATSLVAAPQVTMDGRDSTHSMPRPGSEQPLPRHGRHSAVPETAAPRTTVPRTAVSGTAAPQPADSRTASPRTAVPRTAVRTAPRRSRSRSRMRMVGTAAALAAALATFAVTEVSSSPGSGGDRAASSGDRAASPKPSARDDGRHIPPATPADGHASSGRPHHDPTPGNSMPTAGPTRTHTADPAPTPRAERAGTAEGVGPDAAGKGNTKAPKEPPGQIRKARQDSNDDEDGDAQGTSSPIPADE